MFEVTGKGNLKATEHLLYRVLHDEPNTEMTSFILRETMLSHLLLWENSYCQIIRSGRTQIIGLYPLLPDHMEVDRDSKGKLTYTHTTTDGHRVLLSPEDVLYIPGLGFDGVMGLLQKREICDGLVWKRSPDAEIPAGISASGGMY